MRPSAGRTAVRPGACSVIGGAYTAAADPPRPVSPGGVYAGAVQLVVELVSPGKRMMDRKVKPLLYAEAAIPHFWRLEFEPAPRLIVSELRGGRYVETTTALSGTITQIHAPFPVGIDPASMARQ
ncbi:Uma2 family endonuclease [Streptomyces sp. NPDC005227]|uniref:Uma2 family endonuclease n=1 Tax=unclassified Streptomyces TaxID=2593676 RepID=UPI0036CE0692